MLQTREVPPGSTMTALSACSSVWQLSDMQQEAATLQKAREWPCEEGLLGCKLASNMHQGAELEELWFFLFANAE